ncbi:hypothetical protein RRG08_053917 [Elysia crispata]|uniref:Uncharacterized protein n=1 Tax=Elysia crispata TaxID=231223 RepID=A0AAE1DQJ4_9GAST|nr:hypothetical protein RRG08_053917 [Elysia crispata]
MLGDSIFSPQIIKFAKRETAEGHREFRPSSAMETNGECLRDSAHISDHKSSAYSLNNLKRVLVVNGERHQEMKVTFLNVCLVQSMERQFRMQASVAVNS